MDHSNFFFWIPVGLLFFFFSGRFNCLTCLTCIDYNQPSTRGLTRRMDDMLYLLPLFLPMRSEIGNKLIFLGWPDDNPHPLPVGVAPIPWIPFIMVMVTPIIPLECVHFDEYNADNVTLKTRVHTSENASEKHHYFALAFTGMNSVPSYGTSPCIRVLVSFTHLHVHVLARENIH